MTESRRHDLRFLIAMIGVLLLLSAVMFFVMAHLLFTGWRGGHGGARALSMGTMILLSGVGLLIPQLWAKLSASLLIAGAGVWLFSIDKFRWTHLWVDCLFLIPFLLTLWLRSGESDVQLRSLPNAN